MLFKRSYVQLTCVDMIRIHVYSLDYELCEALGTTRFAVLFWSWWCKCGDSDSVVFVERQRLVFSYKNQSLAKGNKNS